MRPLAEFVAIFAGVTLVDSFPMTVTGKIQKFVMRQQMMAEHGLGEERTA